MQKKYRSFEDARKFIHSLGIKSQREWQAYCKSGNKPDDIPSSPVRPYKNKGWKGYGDWLGTYSVSPKQRHEQFLPYEKARDYVHKLGLKYISDWNQFTKSGKLPKDIPVDPRDSYKNKGWKSNGDWLGTGSIATYYRKYKTFEDARKFAHSLNLKSRNEWRKYCKSGKLPNDIPATPPQIYKNKGWNGWGDWFGTGFIAQQLREYWPFEKSKAHVHNLKLNSQKEWRRYSKSGKLPKEIPTTPEIIYKNEGWKGIGDWLGTGIVSTRDIKYLEFNEAKKFIRSLGLKNRKEWEEYVKSGKKPEDIPAAPWHVYSKENVLRKLKR